MHVEELSNGSFVPLGGVDYLVLELEVSRRVIYVLADLSAHLLFLRVVFSELILRLCIDGSSDKDVVIIGHLGNCLLPHGVIEKDRHKLAVHSLDPSVVDDNPRAVTFEDLFEGRVLSDRVVNRFDFSWCLVLVALHIYIRLKESDNAPWLDEGGDLLVDAHLVSRLGRDLPEWHHPFPSLLEVLLNDLQRGL